MLGLVVRAESVAGVMIDDCLRDCITLATKLDCIVAIEINDVQTRVFPRDPLGLTRETYDNFKRLHERKNKK